MNKKPDMSKPENKQKVKELRYHHFIYNLYRRLWVAEKELEWTKKYLHHNLKEEDGVNPQALNRTRDWFAKKWREYSEEMGQMPEGGQITTNRLKEIASDEELRRYAKKALKDKYDYEIVTPDAESVYKQSTQKEE